MIKFLLGLLFGFIFAVLWVRARSERGVHIRRVAADYNRPPPPASPPSPPPPPVSRDTADLQSTVERQATELKELKKRLDDLGAKQGAGAQQLERLGAERDALTAQLAERDAAVRELQLKLEGAEQQSTDQLQQQLVDRDATIAELKAALDEGQGADRTAQTDQLRRQLEDCNEQRAKLQTEVEAKAKLLDEVQQELEELRAERKASAPASLTASLADSDEPQELDLEALKASLPEARRDPDDLKKIKGIGDKTESLLNDLGLTTFEQIAELSQEQVNQVAQALKVFPDRMERDDWVGQAKQLHAEHHGGG